MRRLGEADWCGYRFDVPLTGREPVLGRLKGRLRRLGPGWGWITFTGAPGIGATRLVQEASQLAREAGALRTPHIHPAGVGSAPLEAIRVALVSLLDMDEAAQARHLRTVLGLPSSDLEILAVWLRAGEVPGCAPRPSVPLVRHALERLVVGGPLFVHDVDRLDPESRAVLLPSAGQQGPGVVASATRDATCVPAETHWAVDPLGPSQMELLLRRWLRHTPTARRLAGALAPSADGCAGRLVQQIRGFALAGLLEKQDRGVVWTGAEAPDPETLQTLNVFSRWVDGLAAPVRLALVVGALLGEPFDPRRVAEVASVKRGVVQALHEELVAMREGRAPEALLPDSGRQRQILDAETPERRAELAARAVARAAEKPLVSVEARLAHVAVHVHATDPGLPAALLEDAVASVEQLFPPSPLAVQHLLTLARRMPPPSRDEERTAVARLGRLLHRLGHAEFAGRLLPAQPRLDLPHELLLRAEVALASDARDRALALLDEGLQDSADARDPLVFDAWLQLAGLREHEGGDPARRAWIRARANLPAGDLTRRARLHRGLANHARRGGRVRAEAAHLRRATRMLASSGSLAELAPVQHRLGVVEGRLGRLGVARDALDAAAHAFHLLGRGEDEFEARVDLARVLLDLSDHARAIVELHSADASMPVDVAEPRRCELHLLLALAFRGAGDLVQEREHATRAAHMRGPPTTILRAKSLLAEADLRAGAYGAVRLLERCERDLRAAGLMEEAEHARRILFEARFRRGDLDAAQRVLEADPHTLHARLAHARLHLARGESDEAARHLETLSQESGIGTDVRLAVYAWLADAHLRRGDEEAAHRAATAASGLQSVTGRSHADDLRTHRLLARVHRRLGNEGRHASHRAAARRCLRELLEGGHDPAEARRLARAQWQLDPQPA